MGYREIMRRQLLERIYDRMTDEEKRLFVQMSAQDKDHREIMQALQQVGRQVEDGKHSWLNDFGANIAGNAVWDGLLFLGNKLFRRI